MSTRNELVKRAMVNFLPWKLTGLAFKLITRSSGYPRKFRRAKVGINSYIDPSVQIIGWHNVEIGNNSTLSEGTWLNVNFRTDPDKKISIGNNCHIGRRNFLSSGPLIEIRDYCLTSVDCHFLGCGHNMDTPMVPYIASGPSLGGEIVIGVNCWLATSVTVLQGVNIGHGSIIGARSLVTHDIPPFSIAYGNPCKVVKRFDFIKNKWISIEKWSEEADRRLPSEQEYLSHLKECHKSLQPSLVASGWCFGWIK